jgi:CBS-domain-containing membrane protein
MKVKEIMSKNIQTVSSNESIIKTINILTSIPEQALPVVDKNKKVIGEINQMDLLLKIIGKKEAEENQELGFSEIKNILASESDTIYDIFDRHEITTSPDEDVLEIVKMMYESDISTIPVVDKNNKLLGVISDICVLNHLKKLTKINKTNKKQINKKQIKKVKEKQNIKKNKKNIKKK